MKGEMGLEPKIKGRTAGTSPNPWVNVKGAVAGSTNQFFHS
jgi:hypothetical protein